MGISNRPHSEMRPRATPNQAISVNRAFIASMAATVGLDFENSN
jgi:hypothetical protein